MLSDTAIAEVRPVLYRYFRGRLKVQHRADAEDLTQEACIRLWRYKHRYDAERTLAAWVHTIAKHVFIDFVRKHESQKRGYDDVPLTLAEDQTDAQSDPYQEVTCIAALARVLDYISAEYRDVFRLDYEGYSYEEMATMLNIPIGTVRSRLFRARKQLEKVPREILLEFS